MSMIVCLCPFVSIAMNSDFRNTVMCTLHDFLTGKVRFMHTSNMTRSHSCSVKTTRTPRVHLVII